MPRHEVYLDLQNSAERFDPVECQICFCIVRGARIFEHDAWHEGLRREARELVAALEERRA